MKLQTLRPVLAVLLVLYIVALFTSMAMMEMSTWALFTIASGHWLYAKWKGQSDRLPFFKQGFDWAFIALAIVVTVGYFLNLKFKIHPHIVFGGIRWIVTLYLTSALFYYFKLNVRLIFWPYILSLLVACIYGIVTSIVGYEFIRGRVLSVFIEGGLYRAVSFLGFSMNWGHTAALAVSMTGGLLLLWPSLPKWQRWVLLTTVILTFTNVIITYTRGAWLGATAGALTMAFFLGWRSLVKSVILFAVVYGILMTTQSFMARIAPSAPGEDESINGRISVWIANWEMFKANPIFGIGLNENEVVIKQYGVKLRKKYGIEHMFVGHAHNNLLQWLASTGILGFALHVFLFFSFFRMTVQVWRRLAPDQLYWRAITLGALGVQVALQVGGLTQCNFKSMSVNHHFIFVISLVACLNQMTKRAT